MQRLANPLIGGLFLGLAACSGVREPAREHMATAPLRPAAVYNVPGLIGLSIDAVSRQLGPHEPVADTFVDPTKAPLLQLGYEADSLALFRWKGLRMVVAYNYRSRKVSDLLLLGNDEDSLMQCARLQPTASRYLVLPMFKVGHPTELMGLRVLATELSK